MRNLIMTAESKKRNKDKSYVLLPLFGSNDYSFNLLKNQ